MRILRASHLGMCFGVRDAIRLALYQAQAEPLTILGELVHNESVLATLRARGIRTVDQPSQATTPTVMITAHGASELTKARVRDQGLRVLEATCPLVHVAHRALTGLVRDGYYPVIIGKRDHVEVRGMTEDLAAHSVVLAPEEVDSLPEKPRYGVVAQTTQPVDRVRMLVSSMRQRRPNAEVRYVDTVCRPTKERQAAAVELAQQCDVVIVVGGVRSNNTHELVKSCERYCSRVHHVQSTEDLRAEWFADAKVAGITAGTSTPDHVIDLVEAKLKRMTEPDGVTAPAWDAPMLARAPLRESARELGLAAASVGA